MKIDTPLTTDIGLGVDRRIIEPGDSVVEVPSQIIPTVEAIQAHLVGPLTATTPSGQQSVFFSAESTFNNTGAFNNVIATLDKGYWEITTLIWFLTTMATSQLITQRVAWTLVDVLTGGTVTLWLLGLAGGTNNFQISPFITKLLIRSQCQIKMSGPATAIGDTILIWQALNCVRRM
jgi:hypothetical protein